MPRTRNPRVLTRKQYDFLVKLHRGGRLSLYVVAALLLIMAVRDPLGETLLQAASGVYVAAVATVEAYIRGLRTIVIDNENGRC